MSKLPYLVSEINAAMEVYLSGRTGQQFNRTAFILCDDCAELASKLFLLTDSPNWSDTKANGRFKNFKDVTSEVRKCIQTKRSVDSGDINALLVEIEGRRTRRNNFFHSTHLLDLTLQSPDCIRAFVGLLDYGKLLFGSRWDSSVAGTGNMETCEAIIRIDHKSYEDPSVGPRLNAIMKKQPRIAERPTKAGCEVAHHPEDIHLRLAIRNGGNGLRDRLRALL